jgi:large subunit ribosomal protein L21
MLAVIKTGGKQYVVNPGQRIKIEKIEVEVGKEIVFNEGLLLENNGEVTLGTPFIEKAVVKGTVLTQDRYKKIIIFKYKSKKRSRVKNGHRQPFTEVKITEIK